MLGHTTVLATSGDNYNSAPERVLEGGEVGSGGGGSSNSSEDDKNIMNRVVDEGEKMNYGANRWPRQETLALLKIRSDMDSLFRDSIPKGPLWEEVSRKLAELGYHRSAKKCKEKFENVYKYHKRTKDGRTGKAEGKNYRFFDQLQALEHHNHQPPPKPPVPPQVAATITAPSPWNTNNPPPTVPSMPNPINAMPLNIVTPPPTTNPTMPTPISSQPEKLHSQNKTFPSFQTLSTHLFSSSTSSSTASDEELEKESRKRKRKWKYFFHRLTKNVIEKQEELQRQFLETVEKYENERILREESWRMQEMARNNREHEILIQERSSAAAKDAAVIQFLQKISGQEQLSLPDKNINATITPPPPPVQAQPPPQQAKPPPPLPAIVPAVANLDFTKRDNGGSNATDATSSRWPKAEVQALIDLRTSLDIKYQDNGPKGPLWEEISAGMKNLGYNRSAKRCKEKWENINKYFKKVKESNKKRSEDSKTCPYFFQLDALYKEKNKNNDVSVVNLNSAGYAASPISTVHAPVMVRPEQQWPTKENQLGTILVDNERINTDQNFEDEDDDDEDIETEDDDDDGGGFEVVASKPPEASLGANGE